jgi:nucleotide-binding universal stress UspA family protein
LLVQGPAAEAILLEARRLEVDAIVIGSRSHGALVHALVGSVAHGVLRAARRPVVVVPDPAA